ncbi:brother of CDO-like [Sceloporus undulatus]|uniref:brother of CDO-like n=1 Tax=Sceloporus undulatus TaxID=8520 RepID=UPI001C4C37B8|nr:brother of CDO-like [Sceloporus undulatus]
MQRSPSPGPDNHSFLYGLPDDSTHQLLQQSNNYHHHHEQFVGLCNSVPQRKGNSTVKDIKYPVFHTDSTCCLGLVPVQDVERTDFCQDRRQT